MTASTDLDDTLANIRARAEAATPGPWRHTDSEAVYDVYQAGLAVLGVDGDPVAHVADEWYEADEGEPTPFHDAEFIAHARADVELLLTLLDQVTTQRNEIQANRDALAHKVAEQRAVIARVRALDRGHVDVRCAFPDDSCRCAIPLFDLRAALDGADTTTTDGSEA